MYNLPKILFMSYETYCSWFYVEKKISSTIELGQ